LKEEEVKSKEEEETKSKEEEDTKSTDDEEEDRKLQDPASSKNGKGKRKRSAEEEEHEEDDDITTIIVCTANNGKGRRKWDKNQSCVFCSVKRRKIDRHLRDVHSEESEVAEILAIKYDRTDSVKLRKKKKRLRKIGWNRLRKKGNFLHNNEVLKNGRGFFIPEKRPTKDQSHTNYLFCEFCLAAYSKRDLRKHLKRCTEKPTGYIVGKRVQSSASMFMFTPPSASDSLKNVMERMIVDDVSRCVKSDSLIIEYGNKMCLRLRMEGDQQHHISNKMRELARLVIETRKCCDQVSSLQDVLMPKNFNFVIEAVTELAGWNEDEGCMETPSIGIKLGHSLKRCSLILKARGIRENIHSLKKQADEFCELVKLSWNDEISRLARTELYRRKWNKPKLLPLTSDLQILGNHLKETITTSLNALANDNNDTASYRDLETSLLANIILFNRRRSGEPAKMEVANFKTLTEKENPMNDEVKESLTEFERKLCTT
ncbi:uncharacterized protein, partial [Clytia hemisphaerica]|uniref:uncharacterized protein n=1 Tax=Clytia hemisphaerica TaxID=252671 RepID=UPI0034D49B13